jgi:hypothetical protein
MRNHCMPPDRKHFKDIAVLHNEALIDGVELKVGLSAEPDSCVMKFAGS